MYHTWTSTWKIRLHLTHIVNIKKTIFQKSIIKLESTSQKYVKLIKFVVQTISTLLTFHIKYFLSTIKNWINLNQNWTHLKINKKKIVNKNYNSLKISNWSSNKEINLIFLVKKSIVFLLFFFRIWKVLKTYAFVLYFSFTRYFIKKNQKLFHSSGKV